MTLTHLSIDNFLGFDRREVDFAPTLTVLHGGEPWVYRLGNYVEAAEWLEASVRLEPADPTLNDHLGDVYWRLGRRIEARFQWQRAMTLHPDDPEAIRSKIESGLPSAPAPRSANR